MALHHAERKRAGKRGEFNDHIRSFPVVPTQLLSKEEILRHSNPLNGIKMLVHMIMSRPGWFLGFPDLIRVTLKYLGTIRSNYIFNENDEERKIAIQTKTALAKFTFPVKAW